jgi:hypothetical protein
MTRYGQWKQRRVEKAQRDKLAAQRRRRLEEEARIRERDRKLDEQSEYWKMRLEEARSADEDD